MLGLLKETPMSGYELKKQLTVKLGAFWRVSYGSLYPCLKRLAADGALDVEVARFTSRKKHVYRLTERGNRLFHQLLESADMHDLEQDRFSLRLAFFRYLPPETRIRLLERRRQALQQRLATIAESTRAGRGGADDYARALMEHHRETIGSDITWLEGLIAAERAKSVTTRGLKRRRAALRGKVGSRSEAVAREQGSSSEAVAREHGSSSEAVARGKEHVS